MPGAGRDGVLRRRGRALVRAIHHGDECAVVAAWATGRGAAAGAGAVTGSRGPCDRADALRAEPRPRPRALPRPLQERPPARPDPAPPAVAAPEPDRRPVPGARLGDHRAADRGRARVRDPAPAHLALRPPQRVRHARGLAVGEHDRRPRPPSCRRATCPPAARSRWCCARARWPPAASISPPPTTSRLAAARCGSARSARGRSRSSPSTARAATTSCPPATSPTSSSWAGWRGSGAARRWTRCATGSPYAPYQGLAGIYLLVGGHALTAAKPPATVRGGYPVTRPLRAGARW